LFLNYDASEVQGERRGELVRALLSRSLHSPLQLVCDGKGTANKTQKPPTQWVRVGGTDYCNWLIISTIRFLAFLGNQAISVEILECNALPLDSRNQPDQLLDIFYLTHGYRSFSK
jgi:hypothetical protein